MSSYFIEALDFQKKRNWKYIQDVCWVHAKYISFNVLYKNDEYFNIIRNFEEDLVSMDPNLKLFSTREIIKLQSSEGLRSLFSNLSFDDYLNLCLEDISFWDNKSEFLATITHEDYIIVRDDFTQYIAGSNLTFETPWK